MPSEHRSGQLPGKVLLFQPFHFDLLGGTAAEDDGGNTAGATQAAARTRTLDVTRFGVEFDGHA